MRDGSPRRRRPRKRCRKVLCGQRRERFGGRRVASDVVRLRGFGNQQRKKRQIAQRIAADGGGRRASQRDNPLPGLTASRHQRDPGQRSCRESEEREQQDGEESLPADGAESVGDVVQTDEPHLPDKQRQSGCGQQHSGREGGGRHGESSPAPLYQGWFGRLACCSGAPRSAGPSRVSAASVVRIVIGVYGFIRRRW